MLQGTVQTSSSIQPGLSFPLSRQFGRTTTTSATTTIANAGTLSGAAATLSGSDAWQQNWNVVPISDANTLRNLRALYRFAVWGNAQSLMSEYVPSRLETESGELVSDPYYLKLPQCIICEKTENGKVVRFINPKLSYGWLYWTSDVGSDNPPPPGVPTRSLGHYGHHELLISQQNYLRGDLENFILFTMPSYGPSNTSAKPGNTGPTGRPTAPSGRNNFLAPGPQPPGINPTQ